MTYLVDHVICRFELSDKIYGALQVEERRYIEDVIADIAGIYAVYLFIYACLVVMVMIFCS